MKNLMNFSYICRRVATTSKLLLKRFVSSSTIFNLSSGYGKCGVSVIRVSGPGTMEAIRSIVFKQSIPKARYAALRSFYHPVSGEMIDKGLVLWFPGPNSFTGEDSCEFQVHGSLAVIEAMFNALASIPGLRLSQPGEFTKRAFFSGKLDLTEVEGIADLIHAETESQRKQALLQSTGALSKLYKNWREELIKCVAHMEAFINFAEDENIEDGIIETLKSDLMAIKNDIQKHLNDQRQGEILRNGVRTVIIGAPNVGKSSFINLMCRRNVSIVTPVAGTTRDVVESSYNVCGYPVVFADTAGLRSHTDDEMEKMGMNLAKDCIPTADLLILVMDAEVLVRKNATTIEEFANFKQEYLKDLGVVLDSQTQRNMFVIVNKIDLISAEDQENLKSLDVALVSCLMENTENMLYKLEHKLKEICSQPTAENPRLTHSRYRQQLTLCCYYITEFLEKYAVDSNQDLGIAALTLRSAVKSIEKITGHVSTDEILDVVFRDFCIGK